MHYLFALAGLILVLLFAPAQAAEAVAAGSIRLPVGEWIAAAASLAAPVIAIAYAYLLRQLPEQLVGILRTLRVEQILDKAIAYGINAVAGAAQGKNLDVKLGSEVLAEAVQYTIDRAPGWVIQWTGGREGIEKMIAARLPMEAAAVLPVSGPSPGERTSIVRSEPAPK
jgi:hypothetical protein